MRRSYAAGALTLKALYSIPELASVAGVTRQQLQRLLVSVGVKFARSGRRWLVPLTEIERCLPALWASLTKIEGLLERAGRQLSGRGRPP